jgi:hypothetical protein
MDRGVRRGRDRTRGCARFLVPAVAVAAVAALSIPPSSAGAVTVGQATASSQAGAPPGSAGRSAPLPKTPAQPKDLAAMGLGSGSALSAADTAAVAAAARKADASGKPVTVNALTTGTTTVTAGPDDELSLTEHIFPVRVPRGHGWVPVSTTLERNPGGSLSPAAVPGDTVTFSGGGSGPLATISAAGTSLSLSWPGRLPAPVVSGDTATFRDVLPGVDLVLTATSVQAGGFSDVLVVHNAAAAADPALAHLRLAVTAHGVRLAAAGGGGLIASAPGVAGSYSAPVPSMWDSSALAQTASRAAVNSAAVAARAAGASLAPPGAPSSPAGPGGGARLARVGVGVSGGGGTLSLAPDRAMLTSPSTRWPVYIDPSFAWHTADGGDQAFVPTQSDCPTAKNYNNTSAYPVTPVGYDNWGGECSVNSTDYSYFRVTVPSAISGAHLNSATVKAYEAYSSDCSSSANVTLSWSGNFGSGTDWDNKPAVLANENTVSVGPDPGSCNGSYDYSSTAGASFNVISAMTQAASGHWSAFAFRLWEQNNTNEDVHKQFADHGSDAPFLQILYNYTPQVPSSEKATANSDGSDSAGCDTTGTSPPTIGAISGSGPYLWAHYVDTDGDEVQGEIRYWKYPQQSAGANAPLMTASDLPSAGETVAEAIPASFYSGLSNGQVIAWDADATDGTYTSGWSATCYFAAWPTAPAAPTLSAPSPGSDCPGGVITAGCQVTFTITAASNDPATEFVWELDQYPATTSPPSSEILAATGSPPSAALTITVPSPGPHNLWVYASDAGANDSGDTNGNPANSGDTTFTAAGDPGVSCASFADALTNTCSGPSSPNAMISKTSGSPLSCGNGTGAGGGDQFDATALTNAGWRSGGSVTVDGATFTLPAFGSCQPDNVLAADQTIGMSDAQGSALEFLATSTHASAATTGLTGSQDSGVLTADDTVPGVPGGIAVTGGGCTAAAQEDANVPGCEPASGSVKYASGCSIQSSTYDLTVPDWVTGPGDIAAVTMPDRDTPSGQQADSPKIYAFTVPVDPGCQIASVTLPDVSDSVNITLNSGSSPATYNPPALHILGMAVRNTTTATPRAGGGSAAAPAGQSWTGDWASPIEAATTPPSGEWGNQTLRIQVPVRVSGSDVRIRLSDPGFLAGDGAAPLQIGHATVAVQSSGAIPTVMPQSLSFGSADSQSVTIPKGGDVYSNPLGFAVSAGQSLLVSLYVANAAGSLAYLPEHGWTSNVQYVTAPAAQGSSGDKTTDMTGTPFTAADGGFWTVNSYILTGVDITTPQTAADPGGIPTVSVLGDNLIDVNYNGFSAQAVSFGITRVDGGLAAAETGSFAVVPGGVNSNEASADSGQSGGWGGVSAVARLDRDVLAEPGIGTVIIDEGLQDLLHGVSEQQLEDAYGAMITELNGFGVEVIMTTITPCTGYSSSAAGDSCSSTVDNARTDVNDNFVENTALPNCWADFDGAVGNGASPEALQSADDVGDHANLTQAGYTALAGAVGGQGCGGLAANANLPPP